MQNRNDDRLGLEFAKLRFTVATHEGDWQADLSFVEFGKDFLAAEAAHDNVEQYNADF